MTLDYFSSLIHKSDKEAQDFINELRSRIKSIEATMGDDFESETYLRGLNQVKFLERIIAIITTQQNISEQVITALCNQTIWDLNKETELAQLRLDLNRTKQNNSFLLRFVPKFVNKFPDGVDKV
jgi:hypothetical protein